MARTAQCRACGRVVTLCRCARTVPGAPAETAEPTAPETLTPEERLKWAGRKDASWSSMEKAEPTAPETPGWVRALNEELESAPERPDLDALEHALLRTFPGRLREALEQTMLDQNRVDDLVLIVDQSYRALALARKADYYGACLRAATARVAELEEEL